MVKELTDIALDDSSSKVFLALVNSGSLFCPAFDAKLLSEEEIALFLYSVPDAEITSDTLGLLTRYTDLRNTRPFTLREIFSREDGAISFILRGLRVTLEGEYRRAEADGNTNSLQIILENYALLSEIVNRLGLQDHEDILKSAVLISLNNENPLTSALGGISGKKPDGKSVDAYVPVMYEIVEALEQYSVEARTQLLATPRDSQTPESIDSALLQLQQDPILWLGLQLHEADSTTRTQIATGMLYELRGVPIQTKLLQEVDEHFPQVQTGG